MSIGRTTPLLFLIPLALANGEGDVVASLSFANGDLIPAVWLSATSGNSGNMVLEVDSPFMKGSQSFASTVLNNITWDRENSSREGNATVHISNGNVIHGQILEFDGEKLVLKTKWADYLAIDKGMVTSISIDHAGKVFYEGTDSLKGWIVEKKNSWTIRDGAFYSREAGSRIARDVNLPSSLHFSCEFIGNGSYPQVEMKFWEDMDNKDKSNYTNVVISHTRLTIEKYENGVYKPIINSTKRALPFPFRFDLFADRDTDRYLVYFNGELFVPIDDLNEEADGHAAASREDDNKAEYGTSLSFYLLSDRSGIKDLVISEWNKKNPGDLLAGYHDKGKVGSSSLLANKPDNSGEVVLVNGDSVYGHITYEGESVRVEGPKYNIKVPLAVVQSMNMPASEQNLEPQSAKKRQFASISFTDGSVISSQISKKEDSSLFLSSSYMDDFHVPLGLVRTINFKPDAPAPSREGRD